MARLHRQTRPTLSFTSGRIATRRVGIARIVRVAPTLMHFAHPLAPAPAPATTSAAAPEVHHPQRSGYR